MTLIRDNFQIPVEAVYEDALLKEVARIQAEIPKAYLPHFHPYFEPVWEGILERITRQSDFIDPEVELGYHFCYGDMGNKHFVEPKDTTLLAKLARKEMPTGSTCQGRKTGMTSSISSH
ncbi:hypothetical protein BDZ45DRAFT_751063 [Acephala macrosclerotiorum]|nr:hypothetical protein BDZ45DRAFT_751063 [Acephala macrosclerotiorum]